jgi:hypothetical protein
MESPCSTRSTGGTKAADAMLYAFDLLKLNGKDLRSLLLGERKAKLGRLPARAPAGIVYKSTPTRTAPWCSVTPVRWASKASCRSGSAHPTGRDRRGTGSGSRTRTARQCGAHVSISREWSNDSTPLPAALDGHRARRILLGPGRQRFRDNPETARHAGVLERATKPVGWR